MKFGSFHFKPVNFRAFEQTGEIEVQQFGNSFFVTGSLSDGKAVVPYQIGVFLNDSFPKRYWMSVKVFDTLHLLASATLTIHSNAKHFYGFGEQFSVLDFAGKKFRNFTEENGIGRGDMPVSKLTKMVGVKGEETSTYFPLPKFFTEQGSAFSVKPDHVIFDFTQPGQISFESLACGDEKCLFNIEADTVSEMFKPIFHSLPDWAFGTVMGLQGGKAKVESVVNEALAAGNPVTAVWIQDWVGRRKVSFGSRLWWKWEPDTLLYPNMKQWIAEMNGKGVKVLGYINPFIIKESK